MSATTQRDICIESALPVVSSNGLNTLVNIDFDSGSNTCALPASTTVGGSSIAGIGNITSSATTGNMFTITNTGVYTGTGVQVITADSATTGVLFKISGNGLTTGTGAIITSTGTMTTTGNLLTLTANSATTAAGILRINANALTTGIGAVITSSATAMTGAGRLLYVNHTGTTGTSATLSEFASAATDETIVLSATASAALAAGKVMQISGAAVTTGTLLDISDNTAHTTGTAVNVVTNSSDTGTRSIVFIKQDHASASGATPLELANDNATKALIKGTATAASTHFYRFATINGVTIWVGDGTTANGALSGTAGDMLINGGSNKPEYCTGTTSWTALV
jgi:hypothetical protein